MRRRAGGFFLHELARGLVTFDIFSAIGTAVAWLFGHAVDIVTAIAGALSAVWRTFSPIFNHVWGVLRPIWDDVLKPFWGKIQGWFTQLRTWWNTWAKPVTDFLAKVEHYERVLYAATFGPILDTISNLQKLLTVLGLAHTAIGQAIVGALSVVYQDVNNVYQTLTQPLNRIIGLVEGYILDVNGLLSEGLLIDSVINHFQLIWNVWWDHSLPALSKEGKELLLAARFKHHISDHREHLKAALAGEPHPWTDEFEYGKQLFAQVVQSQEPDDALDHLEDLT